LGTIVTFGGLGLSGASAQGLSRTALNTTSDDVQVKPTRTTTKTKASVPASTKRHAAKTTGKAKESLGRYYVDFRARSAASYGHAFIWYGREGEPTVEVAGLHPATESVIPYMLGHLIPVPSETGASYGDLDEDYLTASYRVYMSEEQAQKVFAYIRQIQASSPFWWAPAVNCVQFISRVADFMGLQTPITALLFPDVWVNHLHELNGKNPRVHLSTDSASR
jgi:hypothetical protein